MKPKILLIGENVEAHAAHIGKTFDVHLLTGKPDREVYLTEIAPEIEGLGISGGADPMGDGALLDRLPKLSIVACLGVGHSMVDIEATKSRGIMTTHGPGTNAESVADMALVLMLTVSRRILHFDRYTREGKWAETGSKGPYTPTFTGKTVGIIGLGSIGLCVAKRVEGFDCRVLYHQRTRREDLPYPYYETVQEMAAEADYLVTCCPGTSETHHMIDAAALQALGPAGYVIGVSRGSVVDEDALEATLQDGTIAGAGLEVFETEPEIRPAFLTMENVVLSPHRAGFTFEATEKMRDRLIENLSAHFAGEPIPNPVPGFEGMLVRKPG